MVKFIHNKNLSNIKGRDLDEEKNHRNSMVGSDNNNVFNAKIICGKLDK